MVVQRRIGGWHLMVDLDRVLDERSDQRILDALKELPDQQFGAIVERILGYLELKVIRSRPRGTFIIADCEHRPDSKKYTIFFSRRSEPVVDRDVESLLTYMEKTGADSALVFAVNGFTPDADNMLSSRYIGSADGAKMAALLRRFDLDKEVMGIAESKKEEIIPEPERTRLAGERLEEVMKAGYESLSTKDYMRALESFDLAIMLDDSYDVPWRLKGNTLDEMGYHEQALECYKRALELLPESDETWFSLGSCFFTLSRYTEEIMCYDRALFYNPTLQKALINKGSTLHRLGRYEEALETYDKVLRVNYRLEKVHNNKGATLHAMRRGQEAIESYNRAIELKHDYIEAWLNKGNLLYELGKYEEALEAFTHSTRIRPEIAKGWYLRGMVLKKLGRTAQAKTAFEQALSIDPDYVDARKAIEEESKKIAEQYAEVPRIVEDIFSKPVEQVVEPPEPPPPVMAEDVVVRVQEQKIEEIAEELYGDKAELLMLLGRLEEAFELLGKSLRLEGENAALLTAAGNVLYRQGRTEAAIKSYEHAALSDPHYVPALVNLQNALMDTSEWERAHRTSGALREIGSGWQSHAWASLEAHHSSDYPRAIEDIENALAADSLAMLLNYKGILSIESGDLEGAAEPFRLLKSKSLDPSEAFNNAGVVLYKKGDLEGASLEFDQAIRVVKGSPSSWSNRGVVLYGRDRFREAIACFEESFLISPSAVPMINKGFSQLTLDNLKEALTALEQSLSVSETPEAYNIKGIVLLRMGEILDAQTAFNEALRMAPKFADAASNLKRAKSLAPMMSAKDSGSPAPPGFEVVGGDGTVFKLDDLTLRNLRKMRKVELEAICEAMKVTSQGTRTELINRIVRTRRQMKKR